MKTYIISDENVKMLRDIQVAFTLVDGLVVILQIEIHSDFTGFYEFADLNKFSPSAKERLEAICANWFNGQSNAKDFNSDDLTIA